MRNRKLILLFVSLFSFVTFVYFLGGTDYENSRRDVEADGDAAYSSFSSLLNLILIIYGVGAGIHLICCCCCTTICTCIVAFGEQDEEDKKYLCSVTLIYCCCSLLLTLIWPIADAIFLMLVQLLIILLVAFVLFYILYKGCVGVKNTAEKVRPNFRLRGNLRRPEQVTEESALPPMESTSFEVLMRMLALVREAEQAGNLENNDNNIPMDLPPGMTEPNDENEESSSDDDEQHHDMNQLDPYQLLDTCLKQGANSCFTFAFRYQGPRNGESVQLPKCRLCPFCHTLNVREDDACKHTTCPRCSMHFCHICLSTPNYGELLFDDGAQFNDPTQIANHSPGSGEYRVIYGCSGFFELCRVGEGHSLQGQNYGLHEQQTRGNKLDWSRRKEYNAWRTKTGKPELPHSDDERPALPEPIVDFPNPIGVVGGMENIPREPSAPALDVRIDGFNPAPIAYDYGVNYNADMNMGFQDPALQTVDHGMMNSVPIGKDELDSEISMDSSSSGSSDDFQS